MRQSLWDQDKESWEITFIVFFPKGVIIYHALKNLVLNHTLQVMFFFQQAETDLAYELQSCKTKQKIKEEAMETLVCMKLISYCMFS